MKNDLVCQEDFDHRIWSALLIIEQVMYCWAVVRHQPFLWPG